MVGSAAHQVRGHFGTPLQHDPSNKSRPVKVNVCVPRRPFLEQMFQLGVRKPEDLF